MISTKLMKITLGFKILAIIILSFSFKVGQVSLLSTNYYEDSCPSAEKTVSRVMWLISKLDPSLPPSLLRLHYHDCFVGGCDASILLDSAFGYPPLKKVALPSRSLRGYILIDLIKILLEITCPLTVSCADILALTARDTVRLAGGPYWKVPLGRKDTTFSSVQAVMSLPIPQSSFPELKRNFLRHGMSVDEMITLSGAHTIGSATCSSIWNRLYNYNNTLLSDPRMNRHYAAQLERRCPRNFRYSNLMVPLDVVTPYAFDTMYYKNVEKGLGLLASDQALHDATISRFSSNSSLWEEKFSQAMIHLSSLNVKNSRQGEIRRNCRIRN